MEFRTRPYHLSRAWSWWNFWSRTTLTWFTERRDSTGCRSLRTSNSFQKPSMIFLTNWKTSKKDKSYMIVCDIKIEMLNKCVLFFSPSKIKWDSYGFYHVKESTKVLTFNHWVTVHLDQMLVTNKPSIL